MTGNVSPPPPAPAPQPRRWKRLLFLPVAIFLIASLPALALFRYAASPGPLSGPPRTIEIARGAGLRVIARHLEAEGIIATPSLFVALAFVRGMQGRLKAGEYEFNPRVTPLQVIGTLEAGRPKAHFVTLREGWTVAEMAEVIGKLGIVSKERLLALARDPVFAHSLGIPRETLEGYCFPDTYALSRPMSEAAILELLVSHFREVFAEERRAAGAGSAAGLADHEIVTLASIVEKETGAPEERPLIAAVFLNRLRRGMPLQSDPTVIYGISDFDGNLTRKHLQTPTPYNTYTEPGLPPGPIANPGKAALHAVLNPAAADYLYFVSRNDGSHHFSRTLAEHNRAVRLYQKHRRSRRQAGAGS